MDYILRLTRKKDLLYVGHSMGTTAFYVLGSERPEYMNKVRAMFSLAPVAYLGHMKNPLHRFLAQFQVAFVFLSNILGIYDLLQSNALIKLAAQNLCREGAIAQPLCINLYNVVNSQHLNKILLPVFIGHTPAGESVKQIAHYAQIIISGKFQQYDYGLSGNLREYNSTEPPQYNLSRVTVPVALFQSKKDFIAVEEDVERLRDELPNVIESGTFIVPSDSFNHMDFIWAKDVRQLLYDKLLQLIGRY